MHGDERELRFFDYWRFHVLTGKGPKTAERQYFTEAKDLDEALLEIARRIIRRDFDCLTINVMTERYTHEQTSSVWLFPPGGNTL
jgi:hypothetical protein